MTKKVITIKVTKYYRDYSKKLNLIKFNIRTRNHSDLSLSKFIL